MGGAAKSKGVRLPIEKAGPRAFAILDALERVIDVGQVAGSIRRMADDVGDIDLVVVPKGGLTLGGAEVFGALNRMLEDVSGGSRKIQGRDPETGIQVDVYLHSLDELGAAMFTWTGPPQFNIKMRVRAKRFGLKLNQYGVYEGGVKIGGREEYEMFRALQMEDVSPHARDKY